SVLQARSEGHLMLSGEGPLVADPLLGDAEVTAPLEVTRSPARQLWRVIRRSPSTTIGLTVLILLILVAVLAPVIAPYDANQQVGPPFAAPSSAHLLGLDDGGYDVLSLLIWGLRVSLLVGFAAALIGSVLGAAVGVGAGYFGGKTDGVL